MKCKKHNKDILTNCQWCGKDLCRLCIAKTDGRKAYCANCASHIGVFLQKKQINKIKEEEKREQKLAVSNEYFDFSAIKRTERQNID